MKFPRVLLKSLNPFIFAWNLFNYMAFLEGQRHMPRYDPYDFDSDTRYF